MSSKRLSIELRRKAMDLLARREHSVRELHDKLTQRLPRLLARVEAQNSKHALTPEDPSMTDAPEQDDVTALDSSACIDAVLAQLREDGLQSDERFVESRVRSGISRGHGPLKIRATCAGTGIDPGLLEIHLEAEQDAWPERLQALLERRFGAAPPGNRREWSRRARFAASRGFPESMVVRALGTPPYG